MQWRPCSPARLSFPTSPRVTILPSFRRNLATNPNAFTNIASVLALPGASGSQDPRPITVAGHVRTVRNQKRRSFVELGDGSTTASLQALLEPAQAAGLGTGTSVRISGLWQASPSGKEQSHELHAQTIEILGATDADLYPLQKKYHSAEYLRTIPHLRLRVPFNALLARLRSDCEHYISSYFLTNHFIRVHPPVITSSDCEGAGEVFTLRPRDEQARKSGPETAVQQDDFFREPKYLTVSSQLHLEAYVHEHQRVWALAPTFRAEKSDTSRHLSEFYMLEAEIRTDHLSQVMDTVEDLIRHIAAKAQNSQVGSELLDTKHAVDQEKKEWMASRPIVVERRWQGLMRASWPRITYTKAMELLQAAHKSGEVEFRYAPEWQSGLQLEHEKFVASEVGQGSPVFVTDYPRAVKPFYMLPSDLENDDRSDRATVACFDLLLPELCEVAGGSLREHRLPALESSMKEQNLVNKDGPDASTSSRLEWYLDLRRFGSVPHGGFGLGFDRLLGYIAGVDNVRDVVPWPRYYGKCDG